jgi:hypothetical protein
MTPSRIPVGVGNYSGPIDVTDPGGVRRWWQAVCPVGHYCIDGVKLKCPAGTYGSDVGAQSDACSGPCTGGFFCGEGSTSPAPEVCGDVTVYCPAGRPTRLLVPPGEYAIGLNATVSSATLPCPVGHYCVDGAMIQCAGGLSWRRYSLWAS